MMLSFLCLALLSPVTLEQVHAKVKTFPGVEIMAEMVRPSSVAMTFKIAPGGYLWCKYPTTEDFITVTEQVTWMPDRRQYVKSKSESENPLPVGFESMWPKGTVLTQKGESKETTFADHRAVEIPCMATAGHPVRLFVDLETLTPLGSIATANGKEYEMRYKSVKIAPISPKSITFVAPTDAKPFTPEAPDAKLVKPGAVLKPFRATDLEGKPVAGLGKGKQGWVLNFWFSACTGCVQEMPFLAKLQPKLNRQGISFIGVNPIDPVKNARSTLKTNGLSFPSISGAKAKELAETLGVLAYPVTVVTDQNGVVIDAMMGFDEARLMKALKKIGYTGE